jgi:predicted dinucleotide-binding enzyme
MSAIGVLGSGRVGTAVATKLASAGHRVTLGSRNPAGAAERWSGPEIAFGDHAQTIRDAEIVINATPGDSSVERLSGLSEELAGRILIDVANAVTRDPAGDISLVYPNSSLAEHLQLALPGTRVVKTLNSMFFSVMTDPHVTATPPVAFLSGDDDDAKAASAALLSDLGWPAAWIEDLGGITTARGPEAFMLLVPSIARRHGMIPFAMSLAM